jgi:Subtilase family
MSRHARRTSLTRLGRYASTVGLALILAYAAVPAISQAETVPTAEAVADDGTFLPFVPRPAQPTGLCLVDTGVNVNPDTESVVVDRTAIDGGSGNDVSPTTHGTLMAMMAGAPANGWGMVGTAPHSIQIVSVRILEPGQTTFPFGYYTDGITTCLQLEQKYHIKVIDLSLGSSAVPSNQDYEAITNALQEANNYGVAVVAAAGNDDGGQVDYPAAYPSVLSVGATDTQGGAFCSFSNRGEGLRLIAPGCDLDAADPGSGEADYNYWQGSSESSDIAASALDALMSYRPELSPQAAEEYVTGAHAGTLDIAQTFRNAGLGQLVAEGEAAELGRKPSSGSSPALPPQAVAPSGPMNLIAPFARPHARLKRIKGRTILVLTGHPNGAQAQVRYLGHRGRSRHLSLLRTINAAPNTITIPSAGVAEVSVRYTDPYDVERASPWVTLKVARLASSKSAG